MRPDAFELSPATATCRKAHIVASSACPTPCVLMIDDDPHFRKLAGSLLACIGIPAAEAATARHGLRYLKAHASEVHAVVVDIVMPDQDGLEVIRQIRSAFPHLKVLAVSGADAGELYLRVSSLLGADAVLSKSKVELLVGAVRELLGD